MQKCSIREKLDQDFILVLHVVAGRNLTYINTNLISPEEVNPTGKHESAKCSTTVGYFNKLILGVFSCYICRYRKTWIQGRSPNGGGGGGGGVHTVLK